MYIKLCGEKIWREVHLQGQIFMRNKVDDSQWQKVLSQITTYNRIGHGFSMSNVLLRLDIKKRLK